MVVVAVVVVAVVGTVVVGVVVVDVVVVVVVVVIVNIGVVVVVEAIGSVEVVGSDEQPLKLSVTKNIRETTQNILWLIFTCGLLLFCSESNVK
jgi:hypothetical protein